MAATHTLPLASPGMARICLYGDLQRFGRRIDLRVKTGSEAIRALAMQIPAFRQKLSDGWYQVRIAGRDAGETELSARLNEPLANGAVIHIVPRLAGAKSGGVFQVVLGAALIAVAWWNPVGWLGAAAVSGMYAAGASMILGGVAQMLAPKAVDCGGMVEPCGLAGCRGCIGHVCGRGQYDPGRSGADAGTESQDAHGSKYR